MLRWAAASPSTTRLPPPEETREFLHRRWDEEVLPALARSIAIPAKSPAFDPEWSAHGHIDNAIALVEDWSRRQPIEGLAVETFRLPGRTPVLLAETPGAAPETILLYGHCDKQPEMTGWAEGLGPWTAVRRGDRLYGRGAQDDGYAAFCALTAIEAVQRAGVPHARCILLVEASEESGSPDLPAYMRSSSSPGPSGPAPTLTARTSSCTCPSPSASPPAWRT
jgi:acetylornithine deacetylase/succinyl-diaminopimelate desuccinylase-like protein